MLFMAITSTGSAEIIAVSSILTYDVYRKYINPNCTGADILRVSRINCAIFGLTMGVIAVILNSFEVEDLAYDAVDCKWSSKPGNPKVGISMGWVYVFMGNMIGSAVLPVAWSITWKDCSALGAIVGAVAGLILSIVSWIIGAAAWYCEVNYWSLFKDEPLLVGNLVAILGSGFICAMISVMSPQNYDWKTMSEKIKLVEDVKMDFDEKEMDPAYLDEALQYSYKYGVALCIALLIIWPIFIMMPMGVFPKGVYALWVGLSFIWGWGGTFVIVLLPIYEAWGGVWLAIKLIFTCKLLSYSPDKEMPSAVDKPNTA
jgi:uncharacterized membrane protein